MKPQLRVIIFALLLLLAVAGFVTSATPARADSPQPAPYQFALVKCSGLQLADVQAANQAFDSQYGWDHQLTTPAQWENSYTSRVNEFAAYLGCPQVLASDNALTLWYKIYSSRYQHILTRNVPQ